MHQGCVATMPVKPKRPCVAAGCRNLTTDRYCEDHIHLVVQMRKSRHKQYDQHQRDQQATAFYHSKEWDRLRRQAMMRDHGLCQECLLDKRITVADVVDHIKPIKLYWHLRLVLSNLRSLCHLCHNRKTAADKSKSRR